MTETVGIAVPLPAGDVVVPADLDVPEGASASIVIAHGAGAGRRHPFLAGLATRLGELGVATLRFDFPYVVAGRRMPGPPAHAVSAWRTVMASAEVARMPGTVWAAGKSYGGRMASMAAAEGAIEPAGLIYLGYPLHPPGSPDKLRAAHLPQISVPQYFLSGTTDPFVIPHAQLEAAIAACRGAEITWVDGAGHSFEVKGRKLPAERIGAGLASVVAGFLARP